MGWWLTANRRVRSEDKTNISVQKCKAQLKRPPSTANTQRRLWRWRMSRKRCLEEIHDWLSKLNLSASRCERCLYLFDQRLQCVMIREHFVLSKLTMRLCWTLPSEHNDCVGEHTCLFVVTMMEQTWVDILTSKFGLKLTWEQLFNSPTATPAYRLFTVLTAFPPCIACLYRAWPLGWWPLANHRVRLRSETKFLLSTDVQSTAGKDRQVRWAPNADYDVGGWAENGVWKKQRHNYSTLANLGSVWMLA